MLEKYKIVAFLKGSFGRQKKPPDGCMLVVFWIGFRAEGY